MDCFCVQNQTESKFHRTKNIKHVCSIYHDSYIKDSAVGIFEIWYRCASFYIMYIITTHTAGMCFVNRKSSEIHTSRIGNSLREQGRLSKWINPCKTNVFTHNSTQNLYVLNSINCPVPFIYDSRFMPFDTSIWWGRCPSQIKDLLLELESLTDLQDRMAAILADDIF